MKTQKDHEVWNVNNYPGTRQMCENCDEPTERCEEDSLYADDDGEYGPLCMECYNVMRAAFETAAECRDGLHG